MKLSAKLTGQTRAIAFVCMVCVSLISLQAWSVWTAFELQMAEASTATRNMTGAISQHAEDTLLAADVVLEGVIERVESEGMTPSALSRLQKVLQGQYAQLKQLNGILVYDEHGNWVATSMDALPPNVNNADREYFQFHKTHGDTSIHIGKPIISRSTQRWVIPVSRRLNHPNGGFAGVVLTTIEMDYFTNFYEKFDIGSGGAITLALIDGTLLTRLPFDPQRVGQDISNGPLFGELRKNGPGTAMLRAKLDGVVRLYSFGHVPVYPLVVASALSKKDILAGWQADTYKSTVSVVLLTIMLGAVGFRLARQIDVRERAETALQAAKAELEDANFSLASLSMEDSLTGLGNRRRFDHALAVEYRRALLDQTSLALVMIDVDYFKRYNDIYGHVAGDACLLQLANAIKSARTRTVDIAARYGGEEFAVLLPGTDEAGAYIAAERIRSALESLALPHAGNPPGFVTVSLGIAALVPNDATNGGAVLVAAADQALYAAKAQGRNCVYPSPSRIGAEHVA